MIAEIIVGIISAILPLIIILILLAVLALTGLLVPLILFFVAMAGIWILHKAELIDLDKHPWIIAVPFVTLLLYYFIAKVPIMIVKL